MEFWWTYDEIWNYRNEQKIGKVIKTYIKQNYKSSERKLEIFQILKNR